jgi:hypothetical protein
MPFSSAKDRMPDMYTSNGFCFCVTGTAQCGRKKTETCGITDTISSLYDTKFRKVQTLRPSTVEKCLDQLDWPYEMGVMRDDTFMWGRTRDSKRMRRDAGTCDVTDRLPPFWYRYVILCCLMLRYVMLCYVMLCNVMLCYVM